MLSDDAISAGIINYGQVAYVSTQDLFMFELQLGLGNIPDVAVFYQGFNDLFSTYAHDVAGLPHNEQNRISDFTAGRWLADGRILLRAPQFSIHDIDLTLSATPAGTAEQTIDRYLANLDLTRAVAEAFGVKVVFVWQPALLYKNNITLYEETFVRQIT